MNESIIKGTIFNIARCCVDDGPGIRTTVFVKGCPLRCIWCHNPESQHREPEITFDARKCSLCGGCVAACEHGCHIISNGKHTFDRTGCIACGKCADACFADCLCVEGKAMSVDEVFSEVIRDRVFYKNTGGGVTVSGGEPLAHYDFTLALLTKLRGEGIHTAIETSGFCSSERFEKIAERCDLLLFDLKETDPERHECFTGVPLEPILENLRMADKLGTAIHIRMPIIPGLNDRDDHFVKAAEIARSLKNLVRVQIMPYHRLGAYKYETLAREYTLADIAEPDAQIKKSWQARIDELLK